MTSLRVRGIDGFVEASVPGPAEEPDTFLARLFEKVGLDIGAYRAQPLQRRLPACLRALCVSSTNAAAALLDQQPELAGQALQAVLIGVTRFFRDQTVFEQLRRSVLPELLRGGRGLRVYSAGCSNGQELYSMAMLLDELGALNESYLLGVDCRPGAIQRASAGVFDTQELQGLLPQYKERYLQYTRAQARVVPALRGKISWQIGNLLTPACSRTDWDVILFRNVAIYLKPEATCVWERLTDQLRPGGVLVTGKAEQPPAGFPFKRIFPCVYRRTER